MMVWWVTFLIYAAIFVASELLRPKPSFEKARPAGLGDFQFPTATEGRSIPLVWGRVILRSPNVVWWGDFRSEERTQKVATGMMTSAHVVIGHKYYVGMHMVLCIGPVDSLRAIHIKDRELGVTQVGSGAYGIDAPMWMGGDDAGGGFQGAGYFYAGNKTDGVNTYLEDKIIGDVPAYRGFCHYVWEGGYVGTSVNIPSWAFEVVRQPDGLNLEAYDPGSEAPNTWDANIMNVLYEIMTNTDWGLHIAVSKIDTTNFQEAGSTLASEGNGFSMILDNEMSASELIKELERQADGLLYFDRGDGKWRIALARGGYDTGALTTYNESNITKLANFARTTWEETVNEVRLHYLDRADGYKEKYAFAQDSANHIIQGTAVAATLRYPGVKNNTLANRLAGENLRTLSYPLAKVEFEATREGFDLVPGGVFKVDWTRLGITGVVFRASKLDYGNLVNGVIKVWAVQDIFAIGSGIFIDPPATNWVEPIDDNELLTADDILVLDAPRPLADRGIWDPDHKQRLLISCRHPGGSTRRITVWEKHGASRPLGGDYAADVNFSNFLQKASLKTAIPAYYAAATRPASQTILLLDDDPDAISDLMPISGSASDIDNLTNLIYMGGEYIGFEQAAMSGSDIALTLLHRGLFHTAPKAHAEGVDVWLIGVGCALDRIGLETADDEVDLQLRSHNGYEESTEGETLVSEATREQLWRVPNAPRDPELHGVYAPSTAPIDTQYTTETGLTGDDARALKVEVTPRNWRSSSLVHDNDLELGGRPYLDDSPRMEFTVTLDPDGTPAALDAIVIDDSETPTVYALRNDMITAVGSNTAMPTDAALAVVAKHDPADIYPGGSYYENPVPMEFAFDITSGLQSDDLSFGGFATGGSDAVVFGETGTYTFDIHTALPSSGIVEINIDGGGWATLIGAATTSNTVSISTGESIELRFSQAPVDDQFFDFTGPGSETGYGVLLS